MNNKRKSAVISFATHAEARAAKDRGRMISPKLPQTGPIFLVKSKPGAPKPAPKPVAPKSDVDEELAAMSGGMTDTPFGERPLKRSATRTALDELPDEAEEKGDPEDDDDQDTGDGEEGEEEDVEEGEEKDVVEVSHLSHGY